MMMCVGQSTSNKKTFTINSLYTAWKTGWFSEMNIAINPLLNPNISFGEFEGLPVYVGSVF